MKKFVLLFSLLMLFAITNCNGQPKNDYEFGAESVVGATKYHFFAEKKPVTGSYRLTQGMDYLSPSVENLKVGESSLPLWTLNLNNDGSEYRVGVVVENVTGYYGGMGIATGSVGTVPITPAGVFFRKKN